MGAIFNFGKFGEKLKERANEIIQDGNDRRKVDSRLSYHQKVLNNLARDFTYKIIEKGGKYNDHHIFIGGKTIDICFSEFNIIIDYIINENGRLIYSRTNIRNIEKYQDDDELSAMVSVLTQMVEE